MPEETPQLPVSKQEVQIEAPVSPTEASSEGGSFLDKLKLQKKKILIGLGVFFGVLSIVGMAFGAYQISKRQTQLEPQPTPMPTCGSCPQLMPPAPDFCKDGTIIPGGKDECGCQSPPRCETSTADWETYTNTKYGYSIKYPSDWFLEKMPKVGSGGSDTLYSYEPPKIQIKDPDFWRDKLKIDVGRMIQAKKSDQSLEEWFKDYEEEQEDSEITTKISQETVQVADNNAIKIVRRYSDDKERMIINYFIEKDNYIYFISAYGDFNTTNNDIFNLILSTFKFLEEESCGGMNLTEAKEIAFESECAEEGSLTDTSFCNEDTGTWWIDLNIDRLGCAPACVIDVSTEEAEINWRCTGLIPD